MQPFKKGGNQVLRTVLKYLGVDNVLSLNDESF